MRSTRPATLRKAEAWQGYLSILPVILVIALFRGYPLAVSVAKSFTNWDGMLKNDWVGLSNFAYLLSSGTFWMLLRNTLLLLTNVFLQVLVGLVVSVLIYEGVPGWRFFRSVYYIPQILSAVVVGYLFNFFFGYYGPLNQLLRGIGLGALAIEWLGGGPSAMGVIILCLVWINIGWQGVLLLGGLSSIDPAILDAARIDGAGFWQRTFRVFLPLLTRVLEYDFIISVVWTFTGLFPIIFSITGGGPAWATTTIDYMIYVKSFVTGSRLGEASALSVILLVLVGALTAVQMWAADRADRWR